MKSFVYTLLLLSTLLSSIFSLPAQGYHQYNDDDDSTTTTATELFLEGIADGLEIDFGNVSACTRNLNFTIEEFGHSYREIYEGIQKWSLTEIEAGLKEFGASLRTLMQAFSNCGGPQLAKDVSAIVADFSSATGVFEFTLQEIENGMIRRNEIKEDFEAAHKFWEIEDYYNAGVQTGKILGILLENANPQLQAK